MPLAHDYPGAPDQLPRDEVLARLKPWLENPAKAKLGQHVKYDRHVFANHGIEVRGYAHDTMLQSYVLEVHKPHGLASLAERHLGAAASTTKTIAGKGAHQITFNQVDIDKAAEYSCEDSDQTLDVHLALWPKLERDAKLRFIYDLEMQEQRGAVPHRAQRRADRRRRAGRAKPRAGPAHHAAGNARRTTWPASPSTWAAPSRSARLFVKAGHAGDQEDRQRRASTDEEVLEKLAEDYPLPAKLLEHRGVQAQGHLHRQAGAAGASAHRPRAHALRAGGRGDGAAFQQRPQPAEHPGAHRSKAGACARPSSRRPGTHRQRRLQPDRAAHHGAHQRGRGAAARLPEAWTCTAPPPPKCSAWRWRKSASEQRRYAKVINFGLIYGMSSFGLARNLGIETKAAANYIDAISSAIPA
jgi:DNA polymerase-1